jgi:hypothetical protein
LGDTTILMARRSVIPKKKRGPPPTGKGAPVMVRLQPPQLASLDAWIAEHESDMTPPEAIRRLVEEALRSSAGIGKRKAQKASEMADRAAKHIVDESLPVEEQERRKRALVKGPKEFREIREDLPKGKR